MGVMSVLMNTGPGYPPLFPRKSSDAATGHSLTPVAPSTIGIPWWNWSVFDTVIWTSKRGGWLCACVPSHRKRGGPVGWMGRRRGSGTLHISKRLRIRYSTQPTAAHFCRSGDWLWGPAWFFALVIPWLGGACGVTFLRHRFALCPGLAGWHRVCGRMVRGMMDQRQPWRTSGLRCRTLSYSQQQIDCPGKQWTFSMVMGAVLMENWEANVWYLFQTARYTFIVESATLAARNR